MRNVLCYNDPDDSIGNAAHDYHYLSSTCRRDTNIMYDYTLISLCGKYAYCIGTKAVCLRYALEHGIRTTTKLFYFPEPKKA